MVHSAGALAGRRYSQPSPGVLTLTVTTPNTDDRAVVLSVSGPGAITGVESANAAHVLHSRTSGTSFKAAVFGNLNSGPLVRFAVPDVKKAASYSAVLVEVSDTSNAVRTSTSGYQISSAR